VRVNRKAGESVRGVEKKVYARTSVSSARFRQKMRMEVDMSDYAMEGMLSMEGKDRLWRLVAFLSKSLNETERNYEIYDKEMLVIIWGLESWRHLLEGVQSKFDIWTDHKNLEYFMKA